MRVLSIYLTATFSLLCFEALADTIKTENKFRVVYSIYSGQSNPEWIVSETSAPTDFQKLDELISEALSRSRVPLPPEPQHMGYRGFRVHRDQPINSKSSKNEMWEVIHIEDGVACFFYEQLKKSRFTTCYEDSKGLEDYLLEQAKLRKVDPWALYNTYKPQPSQ